MQRLLYLYMLGGLLLTLPALAQDSTLTNKLAFSESEPPVRSLASTLSETSSPQYGKQSARLVVSKLLEKHTDERETDFRQNKGQWHSPALFRMDAPQMRVQFLQHGIEFGQTFGASPNTQIGYLWSWTFVKADRKTTIIANKAKGGNNFVVATNKTAFVPRNTEIWYEQLYFNIDMRFYGMANNEFLYDFILYPYADATNIQLEIGGCKSWSVSKTNELNLEFENGNLSRHAPKAYQIIEGKKQFIAVDYLITDEGYLSFKLADYDESLPLVIH